MIGEYKWSFVAVQLVLALIISGCINHSINKDPSAKGEIIEIKMFSYQPASITVAAGTTMTWINQDGSRHTVTSDSGTFDSGYLGAGGEFNFTFRNAGVYPYHCQMHPSEMGEIVVN